VPLTLLNGPERPCRTCRTTLTIALWPRLSMVCRPEVQPGCQSASNADSGGRGPLACGLGSTSPSAPAALELRRGDHHGKEALLALPVGEWERHPDDGETGVDQLEIRERGLIDSAVPFLQARLQALQESPIQGADGPDAHRAILHFPAQLVAPLQFEGLAHSLGHGHLALAAMILTLLTWR